MKRQLRPQKRKYFENFVGEDKNLNCFADLNDEEIREEVQSSVEILEETDAARGPGYDSATAIFKQMSAQIELKN